MKKDKVIFISSFPPKGEVHTNLLAGLASYAKNALRAMNKAQGDTKLAIEVLADKAEAEESYSEGKINVNRLWSRGSFLTFPKLLKEILINHKEAKTVVIQFELAMFGSVFYLLPLPFFVLALKLLKKKIIFVMHQVVPDMDDIIPHVNLSENSFKTDIMNLALNTFYRFALATATKLIVFEDSLKEKLTEYGSARKIVVIPHGVELFKNVPTKEAAREKLGINKKSFVILSFGFLAWYKGTDWLIKSVDSLKKKHKLDTEDIQLVLAGGANPIHENKEYYRRYVKNIIKASNEGGFMVTGFVPERKIPLYFKACDLVIFPYRTFTSSAGPLSIAFSFKKPVLLSPKLRGLLESDDIKNILSELKVREKDVLFQNFNSDLEKKLNKMRKNATFRRKLIKLSDMAGKARSWNIIGKRYYEEIVN